MKNLSNYINSIKKDGIKTIFGTTPVLNSNYNYNEPNIVYLQIVINEITYIKVNYRGEQNNNLLKFYSP